MATKQKPKNAAEARRRKSRTRTKLVIFGVEVALILVMVVGLCTLLAPGDSNQGAGSEAAAENVSLFAKIGNWFQSIGSPVRAEPKITILDEENLSITQQVQAATEEGGAMYGYRNIALFGVDATTDNQLFKGSRSDSVMIASVNLETGDIKLVSVYRDTYLNIGTDEYTKCNAAYSYGGAEQAVKMLNMNLDMDITDFVTVGYGGLSEVIDGLGGVYIDVDSEEIKHINNYQSGIADVLKTDYIPVTKTGYQLLNGIQATAYCRIRYTRGDDFMRASRQREVIRAIEEQAKKADLSTLTKVYESAVDNIYTSLDSKDVLSLLGDIANYRIVSEDGFPQEDLRATPTMGAVGSVVAPLDLEANVVWLHEYLFEDKGYQVSDTVSEISSQIRSNVSRYLKN